MKGISISGGFMIQPHCQRICRKREDWGSRQSCMLVAITKVKAVWRADCSISWKLFSAIYDPPDGFEYTGSLSGQCWERIWTKWLPVANWCKTSKERKNKHDRTLLAQFCEHLTEEINTVLIEVKILADEAWAELQKSLRKMWLDYEKDFKYRPYFDLTATRSCGGLHAWFLKTLAKSASAGSLWLITDVVIRPMVPL